MNNKEIGARIRRERIKKGWSQQQLAKRVGVTWEMISRYERGVSSPLKQLFPIAEALELNPNTLFGVKTDLGNFADGSAEYLSTRFIPILSVIPVSSFDLVQMLQTTDAGMRLFDDGQQIEKFGIKLGPDSKIRVASSMLLPRGTLVCTLSLIEVSEKSLVLVSKQGLVSVEQYNPRDEKATVLAKVLEWVVKFDEN